MAAALTATVIGTAVGATAGALGGWADRALMRVVDTVSSVPHLLLGIFIVAMFRPGVWPVIVSVALTHWLSTARIVRAEVLPCGHARTSTPPSPAVRRACGSRYGICCPPCCRRPRWPPY